MRVRKICDLRIFGLLLVLFASCQNLRPEQVAIPEYPDLRGLAKAQAVLLHENTLLKKVQLDDQSEEKSFSMDSVEWMEELAFLEELNPNLPEYIGAFDVEDLDNGVSLILKKGEKGILKKLSITNSGNAFSSIIGVVHEDKDVYTHHRNIEVQFSNGKIKSYEIIGYQKILLKDTVNFKISGVLE